MIKMKQGVNPFAETRKNAKKSPRFALPRDFKNLKRVGLIICSFFLSVPAFCQNPAWLDFEPDAKLNRKKHIVLIAGDEAYRSEESLPMLAKLLAARHGFRTTVLFSTNPDTHLIDPDEHRHTMGLEKLKEADLVVLATRFREYPDEQMAYFDQYLNAGKPVIGIRTATHAFRYNRNPESRFARYGFTSTHKGWEGGFGKRILGETWVSHHGANGKEGTRALIDGVKQAAGHPILKGVKEIRGITDVYGIKSLPADAEVLLWGLPVDGMEEESGGVWGKSIMPLAWTREYTADSGKKGRAFVTTMGASMDFLNEDLRRLLVNACYWATGLESGIAERSDASIAGRYEPTMFGFGMYQKGKKPEDFK